MVGNQALVKRKIYRTEFNFKGSYLILLRFEIMIVWNSFLSLFTGRMTFQLSILMPSHIILR